VSGFFFAADYAAAGQAKRHSSSFHSPLGILSPCDSTRKKMHLIMVFLRIHHAIVCFGNNRSLAEPKKMRSESQIHIEILLATA
jgi:hypothetical protein